MNRNSLDPEVLAALLDGKLSGAERERALARLASSPDDYELFLEAARTRDDLGAVSVIAPGMAHGDTVRPLRVRRWAPAVGLLMAASIGALILLPPVLRNNSNDARGLLDGAMLVGESARTFDAALGSEWSLPGWSVMRGTASLLTSEQRAFRIGVRLADLDAALDAGDTASVRISATDLTTLLRELDASGPVVSLFEQIRSTPSNSGLNAAASALRDFVASPRYTLGVLLEQARLASKAGTSNLFGDTYSRVVQSTASDASLSGPERAEIDKFLDTIRRLNPQELPLVHTQSTDLIRLFGG